MKYILVINENIEIEEKKDGTKTVKVNAEYINNSKDLSSFPVKAFQNEVELEEISDINGEQESLIQ